MIKVNRRRKDKEGQYIAPDGQWFKLAERATRSALMEGEAHRAKARVYHHDKVHAALEELFFFKCAYCEADLSRVEWEVEHFRPKSEVWGRDDHPGCANR